MKIKDLIKELENFDQELEVRVYEKDHPMGETFRIKSVNVERVYDKNTVGNNSVLIVI